MKKIGMNLRFTTLFLCLVVYGSGLMGQTEAESQVRKELNKVLKELPPEAQAQVLRYAISRRDALKALEAKQTAEAAKAAELRSIQREEQGVSTPEPPRPRLAEPAQQIQLKQGNTVSSQVERPTPKMPAYMEEARGMEQTSVTWEEHSFNFGKLKEGTIAKHTFHFKNTGNVPLKLTRVKPSCGCTTPTWTEEEIPPGGKGYVEVHFNTRGKAGMQNKSVTVTGNFPGTNKLLRFQGEVLKK